MLCLAESSLLSLTVLTGRDNERQAETRGEGLSIYVCLSVSLWVCVTKKDREDGRMRGSRDSERLTETKQTDRQTSVKNKGKWEKMSNRDTKTRQQVDSK